MMKNIEELEMLIAVIKKEFSDAGKQQEIIQNVIEAFAQGVEEEVPDYMK